MDLTQFYQQQDNGKVSFSKQQGSNFAKKIANDFNPIHDVEAKKFIVPGDLLFAVVLNKLGLSQQMCFTFSGMVGDNVKINLPESLPQETAVPIVDDEGREYLNVKASGDTSHDQSLISAFTEAYVKFSGMAFPHLLVPLMEQENVMINPDRPLVIYESMSIKLEHLNIIDLNLEIYKTGIKVTGKRAQVCIEFELLSGKEKVGCGKKNMIMSGLKPYESDKIDLLVENYKQRSQSLK
ncbi:MAG: DUF3581 family protein [Gammaproteobacteria bacterium]|nr:DUF3581 family protein [Gammaproteobacteria bacterium]